MKSAPFRSLKAPRQRRIFVACALILVILSLFLTPLSAGAHAELSGSDPPADGLVVTSPDRLEMSFTEEVVRDSPAPSVTLLDESGAAIGSNPLPIAESDDPRTLLVTIPDLDRGTYTVSWTVTSATDGHTLSGSYAFRVGGGIPPGLAASSDALPAAWAVATRWLTFLGIAVVSGVLLFGATLVAGAEKQPRWTRWRSRAVVAGSLLALLATVAEPLVQWFRADNAAGATFRGTLESLPAAWWWRPTLLIPLTILALIDAFSHRTWLSRPAALIGSLLALGALLGLSLTSHAAGRTTYRILATGADLLHQVSVALWTGGLVALVIWSVAKSGTGQAEIRLQRFSNAALVLFGVALATGLANTGFIFPFINQIREDGWSASVLEPLWTSNYGVILLAKLVVLILPLGLAAWHRNRIARLGTLAASALAVWPGRFRRTLGLEVALVAIVVLGGSAMALSAPPAAVETALDQVTLVASTSTEPEPDTLLVHLTIDPERSGANDLSVRLTDWDGATIPFDPTPSVALSFISLDHGATNTGVGMRHEGGESPTWRASGLSLSLDGWWQIDARINLAGQAAQTAIFFALLPDPNAQGTDAAPKPSSDPEAEALFDTAYRQMLAWQRVRWTETLGSGNDVLVRANFAVVDGPDEADAYQLDVRYSGGFAPNSVGEPPAPPTYESRRSITVGDRAWLRAADGAWLDEPPTRFSTPAEWDETYAGAQHFRLGTTQAIDGVEYQIVTFYLPDRPAQAEAWMAWWINTATGNVERVTMIARLHYMAWEYTDIDGDFTIDPPVAETD